MARDIPAYGKVMQVVLGHKGLMESEIQSESHIPSNTGWTWDTDGRLSLIGPGLEKCGKRDAEITSLITCTMRIHGHSHLGYPTEDLRSKVYL